MESPAYQQMGLDLIDYCEDHGAKNVFIFKHDRSFYFEALKRDDQDMVYLRELFEIVDEDIDVEILRSGKKVELDSLFDGPPEAAFFMITFATEFFAVSVMKSDAMSDGAIAALKTEVAKIEENLDAILVTDTRHQPPTFVL